MTSFFFFFNLSDSSKWKFIICVSPSTVGSGVAPDPWLMEAVVSLVCGFQGHSGSWYLAGRQRINEHDVSCGKSLWARPTSEMYHFPPLSIFVVRKTEQTEICVATQKPNHFSLVFCLPSLPCPFTALKGCSLHISSLFLCYIISAFHLFSWKWSVYHKLWKAHHVLVLIWVVLCASLSSLRCDPDSISFRPELSWEPSSRSCVHALVSNPHISSRVQFSETVMLFHRLQIPQSFFCSIWSQHPTSPVVVEPHCPLQQYLSEGFLLFPAWHCLCSSAPHVLGISSYLEV